MASKSKIVRLDQKTYWEEKLNARLSLLAEKGLDLQKAAKDETVRKVRAKIRETEDRLRAIEAREKKLEEMARLKAEKQSLPKKDKLKKNFFLWH